MATFLVIVAILVTVEETSNRQKLLRLLRTPEATSVLDNKSIVRCASSLLDNAKGTFRAKLLSRRGEAFLELGKPADAVSDLNEAWKLSPDDPKVGYSLVHAYWRSGSKQEALRTAKSLVSRFPGNAKFHSVLAAIEITSGNEEAGLASLSRSIELDPKNPKTYYNRARRIWAANGIAKLFPTSTGISRWPRTPAMARISHTCSKG